MSTQYARQTAVPCTLAEMKSGEWVQNDGLVPSGVKIRRGLISRVNVIGVLVDKSENAFSLDDGTSISRVRSFETTPVAIHASVGDLVVVIGRPREYNNERFLVLEICKRLRNPSWVKYRKYELESLSNTAITELNNSIPIEIHNSTNHNSVNNNFTNQTSQPKQSIPVPQPNVNTHKVDVPITQTKNPFELLMDTIRELDSGNGANIEEVLKHIHIEDAENYIRTLIEEGEIFEPRPGKIKVLE